MAIQNKWEISTPPTQHDAKILQFLKYTGISKLNTLINIPPAQCEYLLHCWVEDLEEKNSISTITQKVRSVILFFGVNEIEIDHPLSWYNSTLDTSDEEYSV